MNENETIELEVQLNDMELCALDNLSVDYTYENGILKIDDEDSFSNIQNVYEHGMIVGQGNFIYTSDNVDFYEQNEYDILELLRELSQETGMYEGQLIAGFGIFRNDNYDADAIQAFLDCGFDEDSMPHYDYSESEDDPDIVEGTNGSDNTEPVYDENSYPDDDHMKEALTWMAVEETCRKIMYEYEEKYEN